eukprot:2219731-Pleurochrysis_carterae.AAC.1
MQSVASRWLQATLGLTRKLKATSARVSTENAARLSAHEQARSVRKWYFCCARATRPMRQA